MTVGTSESLCGQKTPQHTLNDAENGWVWAHMRGRPHPPYNLGCRGVTKPKGFIMGNTLSCEQREIT